MDDSVMAQCPYCGEWIELVVDPETRGGFVQDCDVCCNPWQVRVERDEDGELLVSVDRAQ